MGNFLIGTTYPPYIYLGRNPVAKVMCGNEQVWPKPRRKHPINVGIFISGYNGRDFELGGTIVGLTDDLHYEDLPWFVDIYKDGDDVIVQYNAGMQVYSYTGCFMSEAKYTEDFTIEDDPYCELPLDRVRIHPEAFWREEEQESYEDVCGRINWIWSPAKYMFVNFTETYRSVTGAEYVDTYHGSVYDDGTLYFDKTPPAGSYRGELSEDGQYYYLCVPESTSDVYYTIENFYNRSWEYHVGTTTDKQKIRFRIDEMNNPAKEPACECGWTLVAHSLNP